MKFAVVFDPHLSDKAPSTRKDDYCAAIMQKLRFVIDTANADSACKALLIAGDLFHRKIPSHNSHALVSSLITLFRSFKGDILVIPGNHDISGNMANLYQQPVYVLYEAGVIKLLMGDEPFVYKDGGLTVSVNGVGFSTTRDRKDSAQAYMLKHAQADVTVGMFHQMILPDGETFFSDYINFADLVGINSDIIIDGHYHIGFNPPLQFQDGKYFLNGGSLSRGSSELANLEKEPSFTMLNILKVDDSISIFDEQVQVPHKKAEEIFDMNAVARRKEVKELKLFVKNLSEFEMASLTSATPEAIIRNLQLMGMPVELKDLAESYLTAAYERIS